MSRRGKNEGSIYQREDGRWVSVVSDGYKNGKRRRKSIYGATRKEVQEELTRALRSQQLGLPVESDRLTVGTWLKQWLKQQEPPATRPKSYEDYETHVRIHLMPAFENKPLTKLQPQDVREFMREKSEAGYGPKSVRHYRATLRAALNVAMGDGLIARNAAALAKPPRLEKPVPQSFTKEEAQRFLALVQGHRLEALFSVALALGLREGEALGLRWQDVDLEAAELHVSYALQRIKRPGEARGRLELIAPKTDRSRRMIALPEVSVSVLRAHRTRQAVERSLCGEHWQETGMVFTTTTGTMLDPRNMLRSFYAIMSTPDPTDPEPDPKKKHKLLPRLRFHDLRHSAATLLLAQGVDARYIMELLGHSSITLTMNTYAHVLKEMHRETARQTDAVLNPLAVKLAVKPVAERVN